MSYSLNEVFEVKKLKLEAIIGLFLDPLFEKHNSIYSTRHKIVACFLKNSYPNDLI